MDGVRGQNGALTVNATISRLETGGAAYFAATGPESVEIASDGRLRFRGMHLGRVNEIRGEVGAGAAEWVRGLFY